MINPAAAAASAADAVARAAWAEAVEAADRALSRPPHDSQTLKGPGPAGILLRSAPAALSVQTWCSTDDSAAGCQLLLLLGSCAATRREF